MHVMHRRNGQFASCEPCRVGKLRCDHGRPVCARCTRRKLESRCYYHPAPLSRRTRQDFVAADLSAQQYATRTAYSNSHLRDHVSGNTWRGAPDTTASTSREELVRHIDGTHHPQDPSSLPSEHARHSQTEPSLRWRAQCADLVGCLIHLQKFHHIRELVSGYYARTPLALVPSQVIIPALSAVGNTLRQHGLSDSKPPDHQRCNRLAEAVLVATAAPITVTSSLAPGDYMSMFTADNVRVEFLGLVLSIAARACLQDRKYWQNVPGVSVPDMFRASTTCLQLAREVAQVNDVLIWLGQDHAMLVSWLEGQKCM